MKAFPTNRVMSIRSFPWKPMNMSTLIGVDNPASVTSQESINLTKFQPLTQNRSEKVSQMFGRGITRSQTQQHRCVECGRTFTQSIGLKRYIESKHSKIQINCQYCEQPLAYVNSLGHSPCQNVCDALSFLLDNIYIRFGTKLYRQIVGIPTGTICAPLVANLFYSALNHERSF